MRLEEKKAKPQQRSLLNFFGQPRSSKLQEIVPIKEEEDVTTSCDNPFQMVAVSDQEAEAKILGNANQIKFSRITALNTRVFSFVCR